MPSRSPRPRRRSGAWIRLPAARSRDGSEALNRPARATPACASSPRSARETRSGGSTSRGSLHHPSETTLQRANPSGSRPEPTPAPSSESGTRAAAWIVSSSPGNPRAAPAASLCAGPGKDPRGMAIVQLRNHLSICPWQPPAGGQWKKHASPGLPRQGSDKTNRPPFMNGRVRPNRTGAWALWRHRAPRCDATRRAPSRARSAASMCGLFQAVKRLFHPDSRLWHTSRLSLVRSRGGQRGEDAVACAARAANRERRPPGGGDAARLSAKALESDPFNPAGKA